MATRARICVLKTAAPISMCGIIYTVLLERVLHGLGDDQTKQ